MFAYLLACLCVCVVCVCVDLKFINLQNSLSLQSFDYTYEASIAKKGAFVDTSFCTRLINFSS